MCVKNHTFTWPSYSSCSGQRVTFKNIRYFRIHDAFCRESFEKPRRGNGFIGTPANHRLYIPMDFYIFFSYVTWQYYRDKMNNKPMGPNLLIHKCPFISKNNNTKYFNCGLCSFLFFKLFIFKISNNVFQLYETSIKLKKQKISEYARPLVRTVVILNILSTPDFLQRVCRENIEDCHKNLDLFI